MRFVNELLYHTKVPKVIFASFLALMPKVDNPQIVDDSRPTCLISSLYRIISNILVAIVKRVMNGLISKCQSAFLTHKQMTDCILVVNEIMNYALR